ncbi:sigma-54 dependent transcriptional regulator [Haliovirga abyssi]|uniref:DNA-binding transcriptional regulator NtrC n=1 Tax=Haliovirga abyssi TaxID=2996794 RepID=A0AAU9DX59_9FUSO|nr:sigma-54 dependent transcriptional regulator [Haliovirga abyssi]BDU50971.1 nitrogen assimilation regulatory protein [Haliovirga abyssi]
MKVLGIEIEDKERDILTRLFIENGDSIDYEDGGLLVNKEFKKKKYNIVVIDSDKFEYDELMILVKEISSIDKKIVVLVIGENSTLQMIAGVIKNGAYDYILKPLEGVEILTVSEKALKDQKIKAEKFTPRIFFGEEDEIIGTTKRMIEIFKLIGKVASSNVSVLITGESGTGKELIAKAIHEFSDRKDDKFVAVNCTAIPSTLMESEFFGYEKGAFTGAIARKIGKFELANEGTLFLDEVGDMELDIQAKLLRVLQENEFVRVGGTETISVDVRIVVATNKSLEDMITDGKFRDDLYHRLKVVEIELPPLRERKDDIPILIEHFVKVFNGELNKNIKGVSKLAMKKIMSYDWPGNIRELKNSIKSGMAVCRGDSILPEDLPGDVTGAKISKRHGDIQDWILADWIEGELSILSQNKEKNYYNSIISRVERELIRQLLESTNGKKVDTAELLGITRNTLRSKMNAYGLE